VVLLALGYLGYMRSLRKGVEERLDRFRSQGLPVTLDELVPRFLEAVPSDLLIGKPVTFTVERAADSQ
jgi:hypothetical protein